MGCSFINHPAPNGGTHDYGNHRMGIIGFLWIFFFFFIIECYGIVWGEHGITWETYGISMGLTGTMRMIWKIWGKQETMSIQRNGILIYHNISILGMMSI